MSVHYLSIPHALLWISGNNKAESLRNLQLNSLKTVSYFSIWEQKDQINLSKLGRKWGVLEKYSPKYRLVNANPTCSSIVN